MPSAFFANGFILVQQKCAELFSQFELGGTGGTELVPVKIYQNDYETEVEGQFYLLNFGCIKESFIPDKSIGLRPAIQTAEGSIWSDPVGAEDHQLAVAAKALHGPDLWFEKGMPQVIFMSGRLRDALKAQNLHVPFKFIKCRVVES